MELNSLIFWNAILSLVYAPLVYMIRTNLQEIKRLDVLINKTREEIPRFYVTKADLHTDLNRLFVRLDKIEDKIDKLAENQ
jgi:hypothetical protein